MSQNHFQDVYQHPHLRYSSELGSLNQANQLISSQPSLSRFQEFKHRYQDIKSRQRIGAESHDWEQRETINSRGSRSRSPVQIIEGKPAVVRGTRNSQLYFHEYDQMIVPNQSSPQRLETLNTQTTLSNARKELSASPPRENPAVYDSNYHANIQNKPFFGVESGRLTPQSHRSAENASPQHSLAAKQESFRLHPNPTRNTPQSNQSSRFFEHPAPNNSGSFDHQSPSFSPNNRTHGSIEAHSSQNILHELEEFLQAGKTGQDCDLTPVLETGLELGQENSGQFSFQEEKQSPQEKNQELSPSFHIQPAEQSFFRPSPYTSSRRTHNPTSSTKDCAEANHSHNIVAEFKPESAEANQTPKPEISPQTQSQTLDQSIAGFMNERKKILARLTPTLGG